MVSPIVLKAVLRLAAVSSGINPRDIDDYGNNSLILQHAAVMPGLIPPLPALQLMVRYVYSMTECFVESVLDTWKPAFVKDGPEPSFKMHKFSDSNHQKIWDSAVTLMSRLGKLASPSQYTLFKWADWLTRWR